MTRRFELIDLLRGAAAGLVLLSHVAFWTGASGIDVSGPLLARGDSGVAVFFAVSAFLLLRPWIAGSAPPLRSYAIRRVARILPAYLVALFAVVTVAAWRPEATGGVGGLGKVLTHVLLLQGYTNDSYQGFTQTWSLTTEVTFYVLVPVIGRMLRAADRRAIPVLVGVIVAGVAVQAWSAPGHHVIATSVLGHAAWFAVGAVVAVCSSDPRPNLLRAISSHPGLALGTGGAIYLLVSTSLGGPVELAAPTAAQAGFKELAYALIALLALCAAISPEPGPVLRAVERTAGGRAAGELSYPVFLWHVLVLQVLYVVTGRSLFSGGFVAVLVADVVITTMIAWMSWTFLESRILTAAHRATRARAPQRTA